MGKRKKIITKNIEKEFARLITLKIYKSFLPISSKISIDSIVPIEATDDSKNRPSGLGK